MFKDGKTTRQEMKQGDIKKVDPNNEKPRIVAQEVRILMEKPRRLKEGMSYEKEKKQNKTNI